MSKQQRAGVHRRKFLERSLAAGVATSAVLSVEQTQGVESPRLKLETYTQQMSYLPGEEIVFHFSASQAALVELEIFRFGAERETVFRKSDVRVVPQTTPRHAPLVGCNWTPTLRVPVDKTWKSGLYGVTFRGRGGSLAGTGETFFIVRNAQPGHGAKILFQVSTNTYQAYNNWGGSCLYSGPKYPRVSFNRPFQIFEMHRAPKADWYNPNNHCHHTWDVPFIAWAEKAGYQLDYCANLDLEFHPEMLAKYRLVLSVGHDEYWSAGMRDRLEAYITQGGNAAFFSGNSVCWQTRVEDQGRALVCYKREHEKDPVFKTDQERQLTTLWSDYRVRRPENQLTGVGFAYGGYNGFFGELEHGPGAGEYTVYRPDHWVFAGTNLRRGSTFGKLPSLGDQPGIAGYECDGCELTWQQGLPFPTGRDGTPSSMQILALAPARWSARDGTATFAKELRAALPAPQPGQAIPEKPLQVDGAAVLGLYERGGTVLTVGSCGWSYGLAAKDPVVERIVRNVLERLSV